MILRRALLMGGSQPVDLRIENGKIAEIGNEILNASEDEAIDLEERLVIPSFVDAHTHLEKAWTFTGVETCNLEEAIALFQKRAQEFTVSDIQERAVKVIEGALRNGTLALRTHLNVDYRMGLTAVEAIAELRERFKELIDIQIVAMPGTARDDVSPELAGLLSRALEKGADLIGGAPHVMEDPRRFIDLCFCVAKEHGVPLDFHVDESDYPDVRALDYVAEKTINEGYQGKVTAGHCTALSLVDGLTARAVMRKVKEAQLHIITLPSCNLYLMGRDDAYPQRRGLTRVKDFLEMGVNIAYASDNIRDPFRPFGNADLLEEALLTAQVLQMGTVAEMDTIMAMGTYHGAKALQLSNYGLGVGDWANLVVLDAKSCYEAIVGQVDKLYVVRKGQVIVQTKTHLWDLWKEY